MHTFFQSEKHTHVMTMRLSNTISTQFLNLWDRSMQLGRICDAVRAMLGKVFKHPLRTNKHSRLKGQETWTRTRSSCLNPDKFTVHKDEPIQKCRPTWQKQSWESNLYFEHTISLYDGYRPEYQTKGPTGCHCCRQKMASIDLAACSIVAVQV